MKGILLKRNNSWFIEYTTRNGAPNLIEIHPEYVKCYFLDEDAEGGEVEFEIVNKLWGVNDAIISYAILLKSNKKKGTLHKTEKGWVVRYKVPAFTQANEQTFFDRQLPLHPDEPIIVDSRWDGEEVEFEEVEFVCEQRGDNVWVRYGAKNIEQLSKDVQKLGNEDVQKLGYDVREDDVEKLAIERYPDFYSVGLGGDRIGFERGYMLAKETLYTEEQVIKIIDEISPNWYKCYTNDDKKAHLSKIILKIKQYEQTIISRMVN